MNARSVTLILLLFTVICTLNERVYAQDRKIRFERIEREDGLISGNVNDVLQDSIGFIWMATENGLCRYDGYNFVYFKNEVNNNKSISYNNVFSLLLDKNGIIWVGTLGGGLNKFNSKTGEFKRYVHDPSNPKSISSDIIYKVFRDSHNRIWITTLGGGLNLFDPTKETFTHFIHSKENSNTLSSNMASAIIEDKDKNLWVGTFDGMNLFVEKENKFIRFKNNPVDKYSISHNQVMEFLEDSYGRFWVATFGGGINRFDKRERKFFNNKTTKNFPLIPGNLNVRKLYEDEESIWAGTYSGLFKFDKITFEKTDIYTNPKDPETINDNKIRSIYKDKSGVFWIGTISGVNKFDSMNKQFHVINFTSNYKSFLDNYFEVPSKFINKKILWAGPGSSSLLKSDNRKINFFGNIESQNGFYTKHAINFYIDERNYLWVGSYNGIHYYDEHKSEFFNVQYFDDGTPDLGNNFVKWFYIDRKNRFWASTMAGGLTFYDPAINIFKKYSHYEDDLKSLGDSRVVSVFEDSKGKIWVGTYGGLDLFDEKTETFKHYRVIPNSSNCISNDRIYNIYESKAGELWIGTYQGLNKYKRETDDFEQFDSRNGLGDNTVYSIQEDDKGNLWIRTNDGISKFDPIKKIFYNYSQKDGLPSMELNGNIYFKNNNGQMFFGATNGLISFYPDEIKDNPFKPNVVFTKFSVMEQEVFVGENSPLKKPINETDEIVLSYKDKVISFEFSALHYAIPSKNRYAYKLEGFLDKWIFVDADHRVAKFTNLNPGNYTLRITASNNDGAWSDTGRSIRVIITPPYWETWWFRIVVFILFLGLVFLFYEIRLNRLIGIERTRSKIARNLHDEVGGTLSSIQYFVRAIEKELNNGSVGTKHKYLNLILESSADAQEKIKDLIWTVNPEEDGLSKFLVKFNRHASDLFDSNQINYNIQLPNRTDNKTIPMEIRQHLWCICKEIITNIVKHSKCTNVKIEFVLYDKQMEFSIEDDGIGFDESEKNFSYGLVNIRNRADAIKANYKLSTSPNNGTKWSFSMKI